MTSEIIMPIFETAEERSAFIRQHATYFTACYRQFLATQKREFETHDEAKAAAQLKADEIKRPVMLYAVWCPYDREHGYDSWIETVHPNRGSK